MVGRGMAVNAEEIRAGSSFPSSQSWSRRTLLYLENREWLIILEKEPRFWCIFLVTILTKSLAGNPGDSNGWGGSTFRFNYSLNPFQQHYQEDNINLMPGLNNRNKRLESFVVPQMPVYPIYYEETIDPHTHLLFSWFTMALNLLFPAHEMIKDSRSILLSN